MQVEPFATPVVGFVSDERQAASIRNLSLMTYNAFVFVNILSSYIKVIVISPSESAQFIALPLGIPNAIELFSAS